MKISSKTNSFHMKRIWINSQLNSLSKESTHNPGCIFLFLPLMGPGAQPLGSLGPLDRHLRHKTIFFSRFHNPLDMKKIWIDSQFNSLSNHPTLKSEHRTKTEQEWSLRLNLTQHGETYQVRT